MAVCGPFMAHDAGAPSCSPAPQQERREPLSTSLSSSAKCPLSKTFLLSPGRCLPKERPYKLCSQAPSFLDRVSCRKMKQETPHHLQPSAGRVNAIQDLLAFPTPSHMKHQKTTRLSPPSPLTRDTGHVRDTLDMASCHCPLAGMKSMLC